MSSQYEKRIMRVLTYIHEHPAEDLSLDTLADVAAMSRFHWHRVFHAMTGETCAQAVRRLRMFRAANWLTHKSWPVEKVAASVGYPNVNSFSRAFRDEIGVSPFSFKKEGNFALQKKPKQRGKHKMFDVQTKEVPTRRMAGLEHKGAYSEIGSSFGSVAQVANTLGLWPQTDGMIGVHYHDPNTVAEKDLRSHAGVALKDNVPVPAGLEEISLVGGKYAVLRYKGAYDSIAVAYDHLFGKWLPESDCEPADAPCYEVYLNDPTNTEPSELLTEIYLPLVT